MYALRMHMTSEQTSIRVSVSVRDRLQKCSDDLNKLNIGSFNLNDTVDYLLREVAY